MISRIYTRSRAHISVCGAAVLLLLAVAPRGHAQETSVLENTFFSLGGGINYYANDTYGLLDNQGFHLSGDIGYCFTPALALRGNLQMHKNTDLEGRGHRYLYGTADLMWNVTHSLLGYTPKRVVNLQTICGAGLVYRPGDFDFVLNTGLRLTLKATPSFALFGEASLMVHPSHFDNNLQRSLVPSLTTGAQVTINENPRHNGGRSNMPQLGSDWYMGFGLLGLNSMQYSGIAGRRFAQLQPAMEFSFGKTVTPCWSVRVVLSGLQAQYGDLPYEGALEEERTTFRFVYAHADLMFNLLQAVSDPRGMPRFTVHPYAGFGLLHRFDYRDETHFALNGGLHLRYALGGRSDLYADLRYALTKNDFCHIEYLPQGRFSVGMASLTAGYILNIGQSRYRKIR